MLLDSLIADNQGRIFIQICRRVRNADAARDLTQEVFVKALQRRTQLRTPELANHWLSRIASNTAADFLRRANRSRTQVGLESALNVPDPGLPTPEQIHGRRQEQALLKQRLSILSDRERRAIVLRDVEQRPSAEVAKCMGCSQATVRSHILNARRKLKAAGCGT